MKNKGGKVLLIYPPTGVYDRADRCQAPVEEEGIEMIRPPMDLAYMAAMIEKAGKTAIIKDYPTERRNISNFKKDLRKIKPDILVLSVTTPTLDLDIKCCTLAKKINPGIITVAKGAHFYEFDKEVLAKCKDLDIVIRGEVELAIYEITKGKRFKEIKGISYRSGKRIIRNKERPLLEDLDNLPFPARHLLNNELYRFPDTGLPYALILSGRGCPGGCIFCLVGKVSGKKLRVRSVISIINEIESCIKNFNIRTFFFRADTFTWKKNWVKEFCEELIKRNLKIRWGTNSRVDTIDEEMVKMMKKAGCDVIGFGIESGNQEMLDKMGKNITLEKSQEAVRFCHKHKIKTLLFFIIGLPWENEQAIEDTINFAKELPGTFYNFSVAYPFPGTEFAKIARENNLLAKHTLSGFDYAKPAVKTFFLSNEDLVFYRNKALRSIYFRPLYVLRVLRQAKTFTELKNYAFEGMAKIRKIMISKIVLR